MNQQKGFTLIEVMIVLAIVGVLVVVGAPRLFKKDTNMKSIARNFIVLSKEVRNKARLQGTTYRLAIKMDEKGGSSYWVEKSAKPVSIEKAMKDSEAKKDDFRGSKDEAPPPPLFQKDSGLIKTDKTLPSGIRFASLETINTPAPVTTGMGYIYFFPEGFVEAATLQMATEKATWTLVFNPLTGRADVVEKAISLKEVRQ